MSNSTASGALRRSSVDAVLAYAWDTGVFTASEAMTAVGLTRSTTIDVLEELVEFGLLRELPNASIVGLGRNLAACGAAAVCNANVTVDIIEPQTMYEPRQQQLDLRLSRLFRLGSTRRLRGNFDIYNLCNASDVLAQSNAYGPTWRNVTSILTGRMLRVGAQYDF